MPSLILPRRNRLRAPNYLGLQSSSADLTTYTFTGWTLRAGLHAICVMGSHGSTSLSSVAVTVGGVSATSAVTTGSSNTKSGIFTYSVPSAGTYSIAVTFNAAATRCAAAVYECTGFSATAVDTANTVGLADESVVIDVAAGGALIAVSHLVNSTSVTPSFTAGIAKTRAVTDFDTDDFALIGDYFPGAAETDRTVTSNASPGPNALAVLSLRPT